MNLVERLIDTSAEQRGSKWVLKDIVDQMCDDPSDIQEYRNEKQWLYNVRRDGVIRYDIYRIDKLLNILGLTWLDFARELHNE